MQNTYTLGQKYPLPHNQEQFERALMGAFARKYPAWGELLMDQFQKAIVTDRYGSGTGCFTHFAVSDRAEVLPENCKSPIEGPNFRVKGVALLDSPHEAGGPAGSLLFIEDRKISMLECHAWTEGWPTDEYDFEISDDIEVSQVGAM
ncbi:MAG: hypothetical protein R3D35_05500 [Nitratireductor sp.]